MEMYRKCGTSLSCVWRACVPVERKRKEASRGSTLLKVRYSLAVVAQPIPLSLVPLHCSPPPIFCHLPLRLCHISLLHIFHPHETFCWNLYGMAFNIQCKTFLQCRHLDCTHSKLLLGVQKYGCVTPLGHWFSGSEKMGLSGREFSRTAHHVSGNHVTHLTS